MNSKKAFYFMCSLTVLLGIGVIVSTVAINGVLNKKSDKLVAVKLENQLLEEQETALLSATKTIERYEELNRITKSVVPQDKDQANAVRELVKIADETGVKLGAITFPSSSLGQTGGSTKNTTDVTQVKPVQGIPGLYSMEINVQQSNGSPTTYPKLIEFLSRLENNRRTAQVTNVTVQPTPQDRNKLTFSLTLNTYIKP